MIFLLQILLFVVIFAAAGIMILSLRSDFLTMTIPNGFSFGLVALFLPAWGLDAVLVSNGQPAVMSTLQAHLWAFGGILVLSVPMFYLGVWGGGDAKLAAAIGLWVGLKGLFMFLGVMAVFGLVLVLGLYGIKKLEGRIPLKWRSAGSWPAQVCSGSRILPYGIALSIGGLWAMGWLGYFDLFLLFKGVQ